MENEFLKKYLSKNELKKLKDRNNELLNTKSLTNEELELIHSSSMIIAMCVRNNIEDFHVEHLTDAQMKELNPLIRNAIFTTLINMSKSAKGNNVSTELILWLKNMVPKYWEKCELIK